MILTSFSLIRADVDLKHICTGIYEQRALSPSNSISAICRIRHQAS